MKAMINNKKNKSLLSVIIVLSLATTIGYGQGKLAEGAVKLFNSLIRNESGNESDFKLASFSNSVSEETYNNFYSNEYSPRIVKSIEVSAIDFIYEKEINTEDWMTESFSNELESNSVESWMTEPFSDNLDPNIMIEDWMTTPLYANNEESLEVEDWMMTPLYSNLDSGSEEIQIENWMTTIFK